MSCKNAAPMWAAFCLVPTLALAQPSVAPAPLGAHATLFGSIGEKPTILYDGLSTKAKKIFILSSSHPVEILVKLDKWTKVRAGGNAMGWMENSFLGEKKFVQVSSSTAEVRAAPDGSASIVFEAQRSVILEASGPASVGGWLPVRHRDGQTGFVRLTQVWGACNLSCSAQVHGGQRWQFRWRIGIESRFGAVTRRMWLIWRLPARISDICQT